ncbi:hypothetical protein B0A50_02188 [Salinomyces thailandicus]|uniref:Uncharacterized protein n=1 Tax=Salinomyces thailandicus TaxID=706561 RepID=A0A4U0U7W3_9PEZI|nr:hypothetical protein B0A50_02188 [Salinomyces thailandica]
MHTKPLTPSDLHILTQVFDPETAPPNPNKPAREQPLIDRSLPSEPSYPASKDSAAILARLRAREKEAVGLIEAYEGRLQTPEAASVSLDGEEGRRRRKKDVYEASLGMLDRLVEEGPEYASARNNRAQVRRWGVGGDCGLVVRGAREAGVVGGDAGWHADAKDGARDWREEGTAVLADLQTAITLASPASPGEAVSPAQGRLLAQAYTQLGAVYHQAGQDMLEAAAVPAKAEVMVTVAVDSLRNWSAEDFEEAAARCFRLGGQYGNEVAKALAVQMNPYARLCGRIVEEALRKESAGVGWGSA